MPAILIVEENLLVHEHFADPEQDGSGAPVRHPALSTRELDVLARCVAGKRMSEIALEMNLSIKTVTWKQGDPKFDTAKGSSREEQLNWFEAELRQHKPTFVFIHYPLSIVTERK
jgi:FixJ family two-component response regulator